MISLISGHSIFYKTNSSSKYIITTGFILIFIYLFQSLTGIILSLNSNSNSIIISSLHSILPSFFVLFVYIHLYKSIYYRWNLSNNLNSVFVSGWFSLLLLFITCFSGYLIPWGQLSYWGTKVVTSFLDYFPFFGERFKILIWGDLYISKIVTCERFKVIHIILGLFLSLSIFFHIFFVHEKRSVIVPFSSLSEIFSFSYLYPFFYIKDLFSSFFVICLLCLSVIFYTDFFNEPSNIELANNLITPYHIVPEWYFLPSFSVLKYYPKALFGIIFGLLLLFSVNLSLVLIIILNFKNINYDFKYNLIILFNIIEEIIYIINKFIYNFRF